MSIRGRQADFRARPLLRRPPFRRGDAQGCGCQAQSAVIAREPALFATTLGAATMRRRMGAILLGAVAPALPAPPSARIDRQPQSSTPQPAAAPTPSPSDRPAQRYGDQRGRGLPGGRRRRPAGGTAARQPACRRPRRRAVPPAAAAAAPRSGGHRGAPRHRLALCGGAERGAAVWPAQGRRLQWHGGWMRGWEGAMPGRWRWAHAGGMGAACPSSHTCCSAPCASRLPGLPVHSTVNPHVGAGASPHHRRLQRAVCQLQGAAARSGVLGRHLPMRRHHAPSQPPWAAAPAAVGCVHGSDSAGPTAAGASCVIIIDPLALLHTGCHPGGRRPGGISRLCRPRDGQRERVPCTVCLRSLLALPGCDAAQHRQCGARLMCTAAAAAARINLR